jgi:hypothetical protein
MGLPPEQQAHQLGVIKDAVAGEQPLMGDAPDVHVTLFRGVLGSSGYLTEATVRELNGADEEGIARMMGGSAPAAYLNAVLAYGTSTVGLYELEKLGVQERLHIIDGLLVGEKEYLFLNILRVTYGDKRTVGVRCPNCQAINDVTFSLTEDVPVRKLEDDAPTYEYTCRNGDNITYRLVTGADQAEALRKPNTTEPEANTILLSRVVSAVNGRPLVDPQHFARDLGAFDRRELLEALRSKQPGPYFEEVKLPCASCGAESLFTPTWADLL